MIKLTTKTLSRGRGKLIHLERTLYKADAEAAVQDYSADKLF